MPGVMEQRRRQRDDAESKRRRWQHRGRPAEQMNLMPTFYISHSAPLPSGAPVDWFIVEPRDDPQEQVESLRAVGRTVLEVRWSEIDKRPYLNRRLR